MKLSDIRNSQPGGKRRKRTGKPPPIDTAPFIAATLLARKERFPQLNRLRGLDEHDGWTRLVLPYPPSMNHMYPIDIKRGRKYLSEEGKRYKKAVATIMLAIGLKPITGRLYCLVTLYRPQKSGDCDNYSKAIFDALKPDAYHDDRQIKGQAAMQNDDEPNNPRAMVMLKLAQGETMQLFENFLVGAAPATQSEMAAAFKREKRKVKNLPDPANATYPEMVDESW